MRIRSHRSVAAAGEAPVPEKRKEPGRDAWPHVGDSREFPARCHLSAPLSPKERLPSPLALTSFYAAKRRYGCDWERRPCCTLPSNTTNANYRRNGHILSTAKTAVDRMRFPRIWCLLASILLPPADRGGREPVVGTHSVNQKGEKPPPHSSRSPQSLSQ